jgi:hypothetical protein
MINHAIKRAFEKARSRDWTKLYVIVDVHDTIVSANYSKENLPTNFYPHAKEVLQYLSTRSDIVLILWTSSHEKSLAEYQEFFFGHNIYFLYTNENPEVVTDPNGYCNYDKKMHFDIMIEDKAGFVPETDWQLAHETFLVEPRL